MTSVLVVDGNNVIGSVPEGWWRDIPGAVRRLLGRVGCLAQKVPDRVVLVLDREQPDLPPGLHEGVQVEYAAVPGRDGADRHIVQLLDSLEEADVEVVTSDRKLREQAEARGARVTGAGAFLGRLDSLGC